MNRSRTVAAVACVAMALAVGGGLNWFFANLMRETYPGDPAYNPLEETRPPVDLRSVQRGWPNGLDQPNDRSRMTAYLRDMEKRPPQPVAASSGAAQAAPVDLGTLLASADAKVGREKAQVCMTCHDFQQGGPDRIGPNLWGVVGRDVASRPGFAYSPAMTAQAGEWSYTKLFDYLAAPARMVPGTKMAFAGMRSPQDRAAVVRFLGTLGSSPPALPAPGGGGHSAKAR